MKSMITNKLKVDGDDITIYNMFHYLRLLNYQGFEIYGTIDFNRILPSRHIDGDALHMIGLDHIYKAETFNLWGTLQNPGVDEDLRQMSSEKILFFRTYYTPAIPVMIKLSTMYPMLNFEYSWTNEDTEVEEKITIVNGQIIAVWYRGQAFTGNYDPAMFAPKLEDYEFIYNPITDSYLTKNEI